MHGLSFYRFSFIYLEVEISQSDVKLQLSSDAVGCHISLSHFAMQFKSARSCCAILILITQMHPKLLGLWCVHAHWQTQSQSEFQRKRCCEILPILEKFRSFALICPACICLLLFIGMVPIDDFFDFCQYLLIKPQHAFHSLSNQVL